MFRGSRYELWSRLLNESGREIPWEVSWPAYTFNREPSPSGSGAAAGANSFNTDLWWHSAAVGHEFRFYNDNTANWLHILDIAAWTHEADLARFHRPGAYAFMDMLESGIGSLTFAESRAHFGLWVLMAQPLHLGMDLRNASAGLMDVFANEEVIRLGADDTLAKMGWRASMSDGRLNGTQVWARELHDGSMLLGLLNAESAEAADTCTWEERSGGFYQVQPATAAGNYACYGAHTGAEAMKARCCAAGTEACVSVAVSAAGGGCAKRNDDGGWLNQTGYVDYRVKAGHAQPVTGPPKRICADLNDILINPYSNASVRDLWGRRDLGAHLGQFCAEVASHDLGLFLVRQ